VPLVEAERPRGRCPGARSNRPLCLAEKLVEQNAAQPPALVLCGNVGVPDQSHILDRLHTRDTDQDTIDLDAVEVDALGNLVSQLLTGMYGSFQRSAGIMPRYAWAASLMI
jgi:hypothetical protein